MRRIDITINFGVPGTITDFQSSFAKQLAPGEKQIVEWPIPEGKLYSKKR